MRRPHLGSITSSESDLSYAERWAGVLRNLLVQSKEYIDANESVADGRCRAGADEARQRRQSEHSAMIAALKPHVHGLLEQGVQTPPSV